MEKLNTVEVQDKVMNVLKNYMDPEYKDKTVSMDTGLDVLGLDSFKAIYLMLDLEEAFNIQIPDSMLSPEIFASPASLQTAIQTIIDA